MPVKVAKNQERAAEDAHRVARLTREGRAKDGILRRPGEYAGDRVQGARAREGSAD